MNRLQARTASIRGMSLTAILLASMAGCSAESESIDSGSKSCTPGESRQCVGVGGCAGGQVCLSGGEGFGICDCGIADAGPSDAGPSDALALDVTGGSDATAPDGEPADADISDGGEIVDSGPVNRPPSAPGVEISPADPTVSDDLLCQVSSESVDPDGDTVSYGYAWRKDGLATNQTANSVSATDTGYGEHWSCVVTPNDGALDGPTGSAEVTIADQPDACQALAFDGATNSAEIPGLNGYAWGDTLTVEAWVNWSASGQSRYEEIVRSGDASGQAIGLSIAGQVDPNPGCLGLSEVGRVVVVLGDAQACIQSPTPISSNAWHHLALVYASSMVSLWVDGQSVASAAAPAILPNSPTPLGIGKNYHNAFRFGGVLDEIRISTTARYTTTFTPSPYLVPDADTLALWHLNEGTGTSFLDATGHGYQGTISGATWTTVSSCDATSQPSACADGTEELGSTDWGRGDIAYCQYPGSPGLPLRVSQNAAAHCASGWHICTASEFTARNDTLSPQVFAATVDDGDNCFVASNGGQFDASLDTVRSNFPGSCSGTQSNTSWGRQELPACGVFGNNCGVICCQ